MTATVYSVVVEVGAVVYCEVTDAVKNTYNVEKFYAAATRLVQAKPRNVIVSLALDESFASRLLINNRLRVANGRATRVFLPLEKRGVFGEHRRARRAPQRENGRIGPGYGAIRQLGGAAGREIETFEDGKLAAGG